ncbi:hypothetical protein Avbf_06580 [Armadillidium vulgare]|nr:hypothetical protein Avbf_06580 [Armadillidium vulgare]
MTAILISLFWVFILFQDQPYLFQLVQSPVGSESHKPILPKISSFYVTLRKQITGLTLCSRCDLNQQNSSHITATKMKSAHMFEEMRLKEELNKVMQGIQEKKREIEESTNAAQENSLQDEDMTDFEKNWKFDFDEGEKDAE